MRRDLVKRWSRVVTAAALGYVAVLGAFAYFAWVASLVQPIDWSEVWATALWFAPAGAGASAVGAWK